MKLNYKSCLFLIFLISQNLVAQTNQIKEILNKHVEKIGLPIDQIQEWRIRDQYRSEHNQIEHIYLNQQHHGIDIYNAIGNLGIQSKELVSLAHNFYSFDKNAVQFQKNISAREAIIKVARHLNLTITGNLQLIQTKSENHIVFDGAGISIYPIQVHFVFFPDGENGLISAWDLDIYEPGKKHWWSVRISSVDGKILDQSDWVKSCNFSTSETHYCGFTPHHSQSKEASPLQLLPDQYRVFAEPVESPNHGNRTLKIDPKDNIASPFGWHDTDGTTGAEYTITRGNNVYAYEDTSNLDQPGYAPDGGTSLNFDFPLNLNQDPSQYLDPAITNLFYWNNLIHDVSYRYGFTEAAGNFQENNYGRGGQNADYVLAEAQDGGGTNNANFATPPDGGNGTMQMYLWTGGNGPQNLLNVNSPGSISGAYLATEGGFGPGIPSTPITANVVLADDGTAPNNDACTSLINTTQINGNIAILYRGNCNFTTKVSNAEAAGAIAVIVVNNIAGAPINMGGTDPGITIPSIMISDIDGASLINQINSGQTVNATLVNANPGFNKDGDFDNLVVSHEYTHGISNRLTGGPSNANCLNNDEQMGEGWSDFMGLMLTQKSGDSSTQVRGVGTYANSQPISGNGIRNAPYTTDMNINPFTYDDVNNTTSISMPHGIGFIWCSMLWDLNWAMINRYGFDSNLHNGNGGNNKTLQLVMDGMKLQPCNPGFIDGRDAILRADSILYNGANQCLIWEVFARRGLGYSADQGSSSSRTDQTEAFDLPFFCATPTNAPIANFSQQVINSCGSTIQFTDQSTQIPQNWLWYFGDGDSSLSQNPTHNYSSSGNYQVQLIVSNSIGTDTFINYINITLPTSPQSQNDTICIGSTASLSATALGDIIWSDVNGNDLDTSTVFLSGPLFNDTIFNVRQMILSIPQRVGPLDGNFGTGGYHNSNFRGTQNFTAYKACTINSAWTNAGAAGTRRIYLWSGANGAGQILDSVTLNIPAGAQRVVLNFEIPGPGQYSIGGSNVNLYRNNAGATYPYTINNLISITSSSSTTSPSTFWYYLYDWEVQEPACFSPNIPVYVKVIDPMFSFNNTGNTYQFTSQTAHAFSWNWSFGDGGFATTENPTHTYTNAGNFMVQLYVNGDSSCLYQQQINNSNTSTNTLEDLSLYLAPNPTKTISILHSSAMLEKETEVQIVGTDGRIYKKVFLRQESKEVYLDCQSLTPAVYYLRVIGKKGNKTIKFIKIE